MKTLFPLTLLAAILCGCAADKSAETETVAPTGVTTPPATGTANTNIPPSVKQAIPPTGK